MRHTDSRILINRGRKAGLGTAELYNALAARPPEAGDHPQGEADGNGFRPVFTTQGRWVYRPKGPGVGSRLRHGARER